MHERVHKFCTKIEWLNPTYLFTISLVSMVELFLTVTDVWFTGVLTCGFISGWNVLTSGCDGRTSGWGDLTSGWFNFAPWLVNKPRGWITPDFRPIRCWACWFWICGFPAGCCWLIDVPAAWKGAVLLGWEVFSTWENGSFSYLPKVFYFIGRHIHAPIFWFAR